MRVVSIRLNDMAIANIQLGFAGENAATKVIFDCEEVFQDHPDAVQTVTVTPADDDPYTAVTTKVGNNVEWVVTSDATADDGDGSVQLTFTEDSTIIKTYNAATTVLPSAGSGGGGGGGGGTTNYNDLTNKPQIAGTTLSGNKSLADLGIASADAVNAKYTKPASGIPASDMADGVIPDPEDLIDDTAGDGDTDKVWSADKSAEEVGTLSSAITQIENEVEVVETTSVPFSVDNTYLNSSGAEASATGYATTDYIDVTDADAISFAGKMGSSNTVFWYDSSKTFISGMLTPGDNMIWFYNILLLKPATAKYVRLVSKKLTASNPPPIAPEVTVFKGKKFVEYLASNIVGDGVTDDTMAVRRVVNMGNRVTFPNVEKIKLTGTVTVALGYSKVIDGMGATLIATDDFYALTVIGTLNSTAAPSSIESRVLGTEGGTTVKNFRITASDPTEGGGMDVSKAFNLKIEDCYIYNCNNGIRFSAFNRDINITGNHLFAINENGILFDESVNIHQCNIAYNMLMFAMNDIHIYNPNAIANFQIVGNDIEIVNYPATGYNAAKCICFETSTQPSMFGEIEISGNTIQGHGTSAYIMYFSGHSDEPICDMSITGNHISNSSDCAVYLYNVNNVVLTGNNYNAIKHYVYELAGACSNILMVGEIGRGINEGTVVEGGKLHAASTATLTNIKCKNTMFTDDDVDIETSSTTNVDVTEDVSGNGVSF